MKKNRLLCDRISRYYSLISVPVSSVAKNPVINANESCCNATSSLKPYPKPFESKTLCAYNSFAPYPRVGRVSPPPAVGSSPGLVGSTRSAMQQSA